MNNSNNDTNINSYNKTNTVMSYQNGPLHLPLSPPRIEKFCTSPQMTEPLSPQSSADHQGRILNSRSHDTTTEDNNDDDREDDNSSNDSDDDDGRFEDYASNICFLVGSILYVWLAVWDIVEEYDDAAAGDNDDGNDDDADDDPPIADDHFLDQYPIFSLLERRYKALGIIRFLITLSPYVLVSVMAAWCYVIDAGFQIAKLICHNRKITSRPTTDGLVSNSYLVDENGIPLSTEEAAAGANSTDVIYQRAHFYHNHGHVEYSDIDSLPGEKGCWRRQRCISAAMIGLTFGTGAAFDLAGGLIVDSLEPLSDMLSMIACHIYLLNALLLTMPIFSSCSLRKPFPNINELCHCHGAKLEYIGDLLFLIGSIIDVMLSYWNLEFSGLNLVNYGFLLSAVLWLIDAIFYIAADYIGYEDEDDDSEEGEEEGLIENRLCVTSMPTQSKIARDEINPMLSSTSTFYNS
jgi:hypothetical protein